MIVTFCVVVIICSVVSLIRITNREAVPDQTDTFPTLRKIKMGWWI
jgi:hypothetical protein